MELDNNRYVSVVYDSIPGEYGSFRELIFVVPQLFPLPLVQSIHEHNLNHTGMRYHCTVYHGSQVRRVS